MQLCEKMRRNEKWRETKGRIRRNVAMNKEKTEKKKSENKMEEKKDYKYNQSSLLVMVYI